MTETGFGLRPGVSYHVSSNDIILRACHSHCKGLKYFFCMATILLVNNMTSYISDDTSLLSG